MQMLSVLTRHTCRARDTNCYKLVSFFAEGVCMSECAASAQGPNFTFPSIFYFIWKSKLSLLEVTIVVIFVTFGKMSFDFSV